MKKIILILTVVFIGLSCKKDIQPANNEPEEYVIEFSIEDFESGDVVNVEASENGGPFKQIGVVFPTSGVTDYQFPVKIKAGSKMQFRLMDETSDGGKLYSPIVTN